MEMEIRCSYPDVVGSRYGCQDGGEDATLVDYCGFRVEIAKEKQQSAKMDA